MEIFLLNQDLISIRNSLCNYTWPAYNELFTSKTQCTWWSNSDYNLYIIYRFQYVARERWSPIRYLKFSRWERTQQNYELTRQLLFDAVWCRLRLKSFLCHWLGIWCQWNKFVGSTFFNSDTYIFIIFTPILATKTLYPLLLLFKIYVKKILSLNKAYWRKR